jgi:hypothetical protein
MKSTNPTAEDLERALTLDRSFGRALKPSPELLEEL